MLKALKATLDPKGGNGFMETLVFILVLILILGALWLNYSGITIDPVIVASLSAFVGWLVGGNKPREEWTEEERKKLETEELEDSGEDDV